MFWQNEKIKKIKPPGERGTNDLFHFAIARKKKEKRKKKKEKERKKKEKKRKKT